MDIENKKIKQPKNKKVLIPLLLILIIAVISTSFALWQLTFSQSGTNVITTGCLKLTLTEDTDAINITDATPTSDTDGKTLDPFTFTLENVCTTETSYVVNLETVSSGDKILTDNYVKANLVSGENELFLDNLKEAHINEEKVIEEATTAYKLHQGKLGNKEKISFSLRLWMDEATPASDAVMEATWQAKITVTASYIPPVDTKNMMIPMDFERKDDDYYLYNTNKIYTQNKKYMNIDKIVFQSEKNPYENAEEVVDFSVLQDRSVLGYYVPTSENNTYTLYIQADGKIKVNPIASYYAFTYSEPRSLDDRPQKTDTIIEHLENLDNSLVTNMSYMFWGSGNTSIDVSSLDTSNVTNMNSMFEEMSTLTTLNLSSFNVSNVISMTNMFYMCQNLETLNLDNFNTRRVTDMSLMFYNCNNLTSLDLSSFDTRNVTNMYHMFCWCNNLTSLNLSSFDTSKVTDMSYMFYGCSNLSTTINITNPNVKDYSNMFKYAATEEGTRITVNYTEETSDLVDRMIATKSENSNVVKGVLIQ